MIFLIFKVLLVFYRFQVGKQFVIKTNPVSYFPWSIPITNWCDILFSSVWCYPNALTPTAVWGVLSPWHNYQVLKQVLKAYHKALKLSNKPIFTHKKRLLWREIKTTEAPSVGRPWSRFRGYYQYTITKNLVLCASMYFGLHRYKYNLHPKQFFQHYHWLLKMQV